MHTMNHKIYMHLQYLTINILHFLVSNQLCFSILMILSFFCSNENWIDLIDLECIKDPSFIFNIRKSSVLYFIVFGIKTLPLAFSLLTTQAVFFFSIFKTYIIFSKLIFCCSFLVPFSFERLIINGSTSESSIESSLTNGTLVQKKWWRSSWFYRESFGFVFCFLDCFK